MSRVIRIFEFTLIAWLAGVILYLRRVGPQEPPIYSILLSAAIQLAAVGTIRQSLQSAVFDAIAICLGMIIAFLLSPTISCRGYNSVADLFEWNSIRGGAVTIVLVGGCAGFAMNQIWRWLLPKSR